MSDRPTAPADRARAYYRTIDDGDYDRLAALLATDFVHDRPDRTITGRDQFVEFMRTERPQTDTTHPVDSVLEADETVAVRGRLLDADGERIVGFVDVFEFAGTRIQRIDTYTR